MFVPRHSALSGVQLAQVTECDGVTKIGVRVARGTSSDVIPGDLAPEQGSSHAIAGYCRISDRSASYVRLDVARHAGIYSSARRPSVARRGRCGWRCCPFANAASWMRWTEPARGRGGCGCAGLLVCLGCSPGSVNSAGLLGMALAGKETHERKTAG
jgi:hypothetical protein